MGLCAVGALAVVSYVVGVVGGGTFAVGARWPVASVAAQTQRAELRAVWVDTFNTRLATTEDVALVVSRAASMQANALFVQVRRRGDAWYLDSGEPLGDGVGSGFDPLAEVLSQARARGLQVHAFLTLGAVWNQTTPPASAAHVFNTHGLGSGRAPDGRANWLTRTQAPDGAGTSYDGYRFGNDFWLDPAHPDVAAYLTEVVVRLATRYPVDGIHLDRFQYPEVPGATGALTISVGYNPTALARYNARYDVVGVPAADDGRFSEWRREQVTNLLQRLYVSLLDVRPSLVVSVAVSASGPAPGDFRETEPYWRTFQDWQAWLETGAVDMVVPHVFRAEHTASGADEFAGWTTWARGSQGRRGVVVGLGAYLNSVEGTVRQARTVLTEGTPALQGMALFSVAANNAPVVSNPLSVPSGRDTPQRAIEDLAAGLRFGRTTTGQAVDPSLTGPFAEGAAVPTLPRKRDEGHVLGRLVDVQDAPLDGVPLTLSRGDGTSQATAVSDGTGVFALPAVAPGAWRVVATLDGALYTSACEVNVTAAGVTRVTVALQANRPGVLDCR